MAKVAIVGSGFIGRAWAITFARGGHEVLLWDAAQGAASQAVDYIATVLPDLVQNDLLNGWSPDEILSRLKVVDRIEEALEDADHVQENTPERLEVKREVFARMDRLAPAKTVLASSTSALLPSLFTDHLEGRHRCLVAHPINPPYLVPAAEVVPAPWTDHAVVERTRDLLVSAGQAPIVMKRELDGFVMNRLQGALLEEAFRLVAEGYASIEDVDIGIRDGLALRWSFMGPFETIDLNAPGGVRDYAERYGEMYGNLFKQMQWRADWLGPVMDQIEADRRKKVAADDLQKRQIWRDKRLMALVAHKRKADKEIGK
jgi:L-gulonate 3-dehydrogenase